MVNLFIIQEIIILDNWRIIITQGKESIDGMAEEHIQEPGLMEKEEVIERSFITQEITILDNGRMIVCKGGESINLLVDVNIQEIGLMEKGKVMV